MAGYPGRSLTQKLGVKPHHRVALLGAPRGARALLEPLPAGVRLNRKPTPETDLALLFASSHAELRASFPVAMKQMSLDGTIWVAWPKRASGVSTDLTGDRVRAFGLASGLVDVKVCAVDDVWSGLKFVRRLEDRRKLRDYVGMKG